MPLCIPLNSLPVRNQHQFLSTKVISDLTQYRSCRLGCLETPEVLVLHEFVRVCVTMEQGIVWGRELCLIKQQLDFWQYIFKWEHRNQISDNQHIWKKFAPPRELQKQWGTESHTKAEAAAGWPGEQGEAGNVRREGQTAWASGEQFTRLAGTQTAFFAPPFLKENGMAISANTHASKILHLLEAGAGIWQSLWRWEG